MNTSNQTDTLFAALAEQLKTPLLQIARLSEVPYSVDTSASISLISGHALRLVDAYMQTQSQSQTKLLLEPINTSAILYDVAQSLVPFAKRFDYGIQIDLRGKGVPIMGHKYSLQTMLTLLTVSLLEVGTQDDLAPKTLVLGTHPSAKGMVVGVFSNRIALSQKSLQLIRQLHGRAIQVVPSLGQAGGAGLAIADRLSEQLEAPLKAYRHNSLFGIGSLLVPSRQLQLVT